MHCLDFCLMSSRCTVHRRTALQSRQLRLMLSMVIRMPRPTIQVAFIIIISRHRHLILMGMVSMGLQVQFLISIALVCLAGCRHVSSQATMVSVDTVQFVTKGGITYLNDQPCTGIAIQLYTAGDTAYVGSYHGG